MVCNNLLILLNLIGDQKTLYMATKNEFNTILIY